MEDLKWIVIVFAALAMGLLLADLIINIKKRHNTRINVIGLVFLALSICCLVPTIVFGDDAPGILNYAWVGFLACYLVCDVIMAVLIGRANARIKHQQREMQKVECDDLSGENN